MKKLFLAAIAVLFLTTGMLRPAAAVGLPTDFDCGQLAEAHLENTTKDTTLTFNFSNNRERHLTGKNLAIRYNYKSGKLFLNGKPCKEKTSQ
jgi:hypothetical protein